MGSVLRTALATVTAAPMLGSAANAVADFASGNDLLLWCSGFDDYDRTKCTGYIMAVADLIRHAPVDGWKGCLPPTVTNFQVRDVTIQYLESHPEARRLGGGGLVAHALATAFRCR
jgi:hypothetical protein